MASAQIRSFELKSPMAPSSVMGTKIPHALLYEQEA
jgi:hypothetical protein